MLGTLNTQSTNSRIRREVTLISSLSHKHIVRYFGAWEEFISEDAGSEGSSAGILSSSAATGGTGLPGGNRSSAGGGQATLRGCWSNPVSPLFNGLDDDSSQSSDGGSSSEGERADDDFEWERDEAAGAEGERWSSASHAGAPVLPSGKRPAHALGPGPARPTEAWTRRRPRALYIQMEFCSTTLRAVIDEGRLHEAPGRILELFRQTLEAMVFLHKKGVLHRDLKVYCGLLGGS